MFKALLITMRPKQWTKNAILLFPFMFTLNEYWSPFSPEMYHMLGLVMPALFLFCILSGCVYLINDIMDMEKDRHHPTKSLRPLPAGKLTARQAIVALAVLLPLSLVASFWLHLFFGSIALAYFLVMLTYNFVLKNVVIIDVFTIAAGFVLRAVAGAVVIDVGISPWLYVCTILLALFLGFGKRRHELLLLEDNASEHRAILREYSRHFLDEMIAVVSSASVMAYSLYTFSAPNLPENHAMMLTIPFVIYGIFRYLYLIHIKNAGGSPEEILIGDPPFIAAILLWGISVVLILYLF
ncbi:MAG: decaprenyl-phosphate phosphoribosyltransferase [Anaerolineae bacterium]